MTRERELECVIADLKEEVIALREQLNNMMHIRDQLEYEQTELREQLNSRMKNECKNGGECGVGGYCDDCYQPIDELNLLRTQVRDLRQQRDDALKTDQEPVGYAHYEKGRLVLLGRSDACMDMFPIYTAPPSRHLSDEEILGTLEELVTTGWKVDVLSFARAVLEKANG